MITTMIRPMIRGAVAATVGPDGAPVPPTGFVFLLDAQGHPMKDAQGLYMVEPE